MVWVIRPWELFRILFTTQLRNPNKPTRPQIQPITGIQLNLGKNDSSKTTHLRLEFHDGPNQGQQELLSTSI